MMNFNWLKKAVRFITILLGKREKKKQEIAPFPIIGAEIYRARNPDGSEETIYCFLTNLPIVGEKTTNPE